MISGEQAQIVYINPFQSKERGASVRCSSGGEKTERNAPCTVLRTHPKGCLIFTLEWDILPWLLLKIEGRRDCTAPVFIFFVRDDLGSPNVRKAEINRYGD
jgi:hypothetical protein